MAGTGIHLPRGGNDRQRPAVRCARRCYVNPLLVVTNEAAGGTADAQVDAALTVLRSATDVRREVCREPDDLGRVLDGLGERALVVVGGDGSVHTAVATLLSRGELSA